MTEVSETVRPEQIVANARTCIGARFRTHGRDPAFGLDCVGVAAVAFGRGVAGGYALRGGNPDRVIKGIEQLGLVRAEREPRPGDLLLITEGQGQLHLAILTETGFVHADARLRRVVETPGLPAGTIIGFWREKD